jgi:hypothetical protein
VALSPSADPEWQQPPTLRSGGLRLGFRASASIEHRGNRLWRRHALDADKNIDHDEVAREGNLTPSWPLGSALPIGPFPLGAYRGYGGLSAHTRRKRAH